MAKSKNSLAETHPELAKQWHPFMNTVLTTEVTAGSNKKVWWKCNEGPDHEWEASISSRSYGRGCPVCTGRKVVKSNCLSITHPDLAKEWHPFKNDILPSEVTAGSNKKVWWKCNEGPDHEWESLVSSRGQGRNCPFCDGKRVSTTNSLDTYYDDKVLQEWHHEKNYPLTPSNVTSGSSKTVWWKCAVDIDHEWQATISNRTTRQSGCPVCDGKKVAKSNCLSTTHQDIANEWHFPKNGNLSPEDFTIGSKKKVWWKCPEGDDHIFKCSIKDRLRVDCPVCYGRKIVASNCLATTHPEIAEQWFESKNLPLTPRDIGYGSKKKVWWKCPEGDDHVWKGSVYTRTRKESNGKGPTKCPICTGRKIVSSNSLSVTHPEMALEWHTELNGEITPLKVGYGSSQKIWWRCTKDDEHIWRSSINARTSQNSGCPFCTLTPQSKQELIITFELRTLFNRIDPKGFKTRLDGRLRAIDIFIPQLNLCIEFDGSYWHKDKRAIDKIKSNLLLKEGYSVIRVREEPLKKIHVTDVISKQPYNGKQVTNDILSMILSMYDLDSELVQRIKDYQSKDELQNEKGLNRYIDKILKEKAEKK
jgi:uncharacterized protein YndB with AHSA1/START domain